MTTDGMDDLYFKQIEIGPMANYVCLLGSHATREAAIIDPAWDPRALLEIAEADDMRVTSVLITHTHPDHVGGDLMGHHIDGVAEFLAHHPDVRVYVHKSEAEFLPVPGSEVVKTDEHTELTLGQVRVQFVHTPGHTPGSQCFKLADRLVSGDTLFIGACGRTDLPGSNPEDLYLSLTQKLAKLEEDTLVFPGHNYAPPRQYTSIRDEKAHNPFLRFPSKSAFLAAMGYRV